MACKGNTKRFDISYFLKSTKFDELQIRSIYNYFLSFANEEQYIQFNDFKRSLGVLGAKSHDFISKRIFTLIDIQNSSEISFDNYIMFFNLVNFGTQDEKLEFSFNFFDLKNKGEIDIDSFCKVVLSICELLTLIIGTPCSIRNKEDVEKIFQEIVGKYDRKTLDLKSYIHFSNAYPEMLDFFNIFNNNVLKSKILKISPKQIETLDTIHKKLINIIQTYNERSKNITLCHKNQLITKKIEKDDKKEILFSMKNDMTNNSKNYNSEANKEVWKQFTVSDKIEIETVQNHSESSLEWDDEEENNSLIDTESKDEISLEYDKYKKKVELYPKLEILSPFIPPTPDQEIKYKKFYSELESEGLNLNNCLVIKDRNQFISYIEDLTDKILSIIKEIDPNRQNVLRRTGIAIDMDNLKEIDKEEFLNIPFNIPDSTGLILFGNKNVEFILNTMTGIKYAVNSLGDMGMMFNLNKNEEAFKEINTFSFTQSIFEKENKILFIDYAPKVFHNLRKLYRINSEDYLRSLCHENFIVSLLNFYFYYKLIDLKGNLILIKNRSLRELCSAGKSGSFFYFSYDSKYVVKTIPEHEFLFFYSILKDYYFHIHDNKDTLMQRYYGLHILHFNDQKYYFVLMNNVFGTNLKVHYKYDLKGSKYRRLSRDFNKKDYDDYDYSIPMKDLDFIDRKEKMDLNCNEAELLYKQAENDAMFLSLKNVNDYSFLIGIHEINSQRNKNNGSSIISELLYQYNKDNGFKTEASDCIPARKPFYEQCKGGLLSKDNSKIYFFGIIDIFTNYKYYLALFKSTKKTMEHLFKTVFQGNEISCKPPNEYYERFCAFLKNILIK